MNNPTTISQKSLYFSNYSLDEFLDTFSIDELQGVFQDVLSERETKILKLRFGLSGNPPMSLAEAGREVGLKRERVRQIEAKILSKTRRSLSTNPRAQRADSPPQAATS